MYSTSITTIPASQLSDEHIGVWAELQRANSALDSPFFRPEFTQAVAAARGGVWVAVLKRQTEIVGFFPFQFAGRRAGLPVGGQLSDFHGVIGPADLEWDTVQLTRACGLATWKFHHVLASQTSFQRSHWEVASSPYMDLSRGFTEYVAELRKSRSNQTISSAMRKMRKIQREVGPLRFVPHAADAEVFEALRTWKSEQYRRTNVTDVFAFPWTVELLSQLIARTDTEFMGMLSALYVGDKLAAVHLGLRSRGVLHSWFPAYDNAFHKYSPGLILLVRLAEEATALGIKHIDLGGGEVAYKRSFMSGASDIARGVVCVNKVSSAVYGGIYRARKWAKASPLRGAVALAGRATRPVRGWLAFR